MVDANTQTENHDNDHDNDDAVSRRRNTEKQDSYGKYRDSASQPIQVLASRDRMDAKWSVCDIRNTDREQTHVVVGRDMSAIVVEPGQTVTGVSLLDSDIKFFQDHQKPHRHRRPVPPIHNPANPTPQVHPFRPHPIQILNTRSEEEDDEQAEQQAREDREAAKNNERIDRRPLHERRGQPQRVKLKRDNGEGEESGAAEDVNEHEDASDDDNSGAPNNGPDSGNDGGSDERRQSRVQRRRPRES